MDTISTKKKKKNVDPDFSLQVNFLLADVLFTLETTSKQENLMKQSVGALVGRTQSKLNL
jgi:hypothetical protein